MLLNIFSRSHYSCSSIQILVLSLITTLALAGQNEHESKNVELTPITINSTTGSLLHTPTETASKLDLTPMQTPASIEAIDREQLQERGDSSVIDAITRATGISAAPHPGNGFGGLSARGFTSGGSVSIARLYDGRKQYGGTVISFPFDTWSVERIEVLRGPASVIYGDGAIGGVINIVPKKPGQGDIENEIQFTLGTENTQRLGLGSGGALSEQLSYRLDLSGNRSDGWVDRGDNKDATFSGALQFAASDSLSFKLSHAYGYQRPQRYFGTPLIEGRQIKALRKKNYNVKDSFLRYRDHWTEFSAIWDINDISTLRSYLYHIGSKRDWRNTEAFTYNPASGLIDRTSNTHINHDQKQTGFTSDITFDSTLAGLNNKLAVGFDINHSSYRHTNNLYSGSSTSVNPWHPDPGYFVSDFPFIPRYQNKANQYALFTEDRLALTHQWSIIGGVRYDHVRLTRDDLVSGQQVISRRFYNLGWRIGTVYDLTPELALYAQYAKAGEPVGGLLSLSPANANFDMTEGRQIEIGLKQGFWQGQGEWTLATYHIRKTNLVTRDPSNPAQSVQVGAQSSRGLETTLVINFAQDWKVEANAALLRARYDDFSENVGGVAVSRNGKVPTNVPQRLANLWLSWRFQSDLTAIAGQRYVDKRYTNNANTLALPSYTTTDIALRWDTNASTSLTARINNLFDKAYFTAPYGVNRGTQWLYGEGRKFELTLHQRF